MLNYALCELSGLQLLVKSIPQQEVEDSKRTKSTGHYPIVFDDDEKQHCALCGGLLTHLHVSRKDGMSNQWRSDYECEAPDEDNICAACMWLLTEGNRLRLCTLNVINVYNGYEHLQLGPSEFIDFLKSDFDTPCIIALRNDANRTQKHVAFAMSRGITYSPNDVIVYLFEVKGLRHKEGTKYVDDKYEGAARFKASDFIVTVERFQKLIQALQSTPGYVNLKNNNQRRAKAKAELIHKCYKHNLWSEEIFLAVYLAVLIEFPFEDKE